jgi:hypothetical protein
MKKPRLNEFDELLQSLSPAHCHRSRNYPFHRFKVSKIALTLPSERAYFPNDRHALKTCVEKVGAAILRY